MGGVHETSDIAPRQAVEVLKRVGAELVVAGELDQVRALLAAVPPAVLRGDPALQEVLSLISVADGRPEAVLLWSGPETPAPSSILVQVPSPRSTAARGPVDLINDVLLAASWMYAGDPRAERALRKVARMDHDEPFAQIARRSSLAYLYWRDGRRDLGQQQAASIPGLLVTAGVNLAATYPADATVALWAAYEGDRPAADEWGTRAMAKLDGIGDPFPPQEMITLLMLAEVGWEFGEYDRAQTLSNRLAQLDAKPSMHQAAALSRHVGDLRQRLATAVDEVPTVLLTDAERRTLTALDSYLTIPEIASQLFLSPSTIRSQVKSIYRKLGASSRSEALAEARKRRLR